MDETKINEQPLKEEMTDDTSADQGKMTEAEIKEKKRLYRNAYHRNYYLNNKDKFNKHTQGKHVGERGRAKHFKYTLSILDENTKSPIISQKFKSLREIGETLKLSPTVISMIRRGKYQFGMGKSKKTKRYGKFRIDKITDKKTI